MKTKVRKGKAVALSSIVPSPIPVQSIPVIAHPSQIRHLPWEGNHDSDMYLFVACDNYIRTASTSLALEAMDAMLRYGMGVEAHLDKTDLDRYLTLRNERLASQVNQ